MMEGILVIDKPSGVTSFDVIRRVRRWCRTRRVGHAGTLDPLATGVLVVAVGQATRLLEHLMAQDKVYAANIRFGVSTDTLDSDGAVVETRSCDDLRCSDVAAACERFLGEIDQVPPMYSALKKNGVPLYRLAREGREVERRPRQVRIDAIEVLSCEPPDAVIRVACSKGTYIRSLCRDLGEVVGCGAHLSALRRERSGRFDLAMSYTLEALQQRAEQGQDLPVISPADALAEWRGVEIDETCWARLRNGVAPALDELDERLDLEVGDPIRFLHGGRLGGIATYAPNDGGKRRGDFENLKVFPLVRDGG